MIVFVYIIIYWLVLLLLYNLVIGRLKVLSKQHFDNTWIPALAKWYKVARRRIIIALIVLFVLSSLVLLTFVNNELLYQGWLYNNQETLDNNGF